MDNNDKVTSWLGLAQAIGTAVVTFYATASADGHVDWKSPMLYVGLAVAVLMAVKAYYTKGTDVKPAAPPSA